MEEGEKVNSELSFSDAKYSGCISDFYGAKESDGMGAKKGSRINEEDEGEVRSAIY